MPNKTVRTLDRINSAWGIIVIVAFFVIFGYGLRATGQSSEKKLDGILYAVQEQNAVLTILVESLKDKDRDHISFDTKITDNAKTMREIVRLMDRVVILIERDGVTPR